MCWDSSWSVEGARVCKAGTALYTNSSPTVLASECTKPQMRDFVCLQEKGPLLLPHFPTKLRIANSASALLPEGKEQLL